MEVVGVTDFEGHTLPSPERYEPTGRRGRTVLRHVYRALDGIQVQFGVTGRRGRRDGGVFGLPGFRWTADARVRPAYEG